ncbi:hypothetical protein [Shewanella decolorationis]|uniref:Uncharacterized protein n=1 Tax=Shewanella decolorationis S12 TaxID=1353536 RepID=A0ABP2Z2Y9_9GAMM|nr:hypothetical protein [Shewanella decolorationis]ESE40967.1 hypothetical protein SHD_2524 [Shewanella decolorationis S12]GLR30759.1 hypothetical protein GCM10007922_03160 [Shewanella decolorationis]
MSFFTSWRLSPLPAFVGLSLLSTPALAFDSSGGSASLFIIVGLGGFTLLNSLMQGLFFFAGQYRNPIFAKRHVLSALIVPLLAFALTLYDHSSWSDFALNLGMIIVGVGLILLPLQLRQLNQPSNQHANWLLNLGAILVLGISYLVPPCALFAIILAHIAIASRPNTEAQKLIAKTMSYLILAASYALFGYWLFHLLSKFGA